MSQPPILFSFRRCPYAMRARMALWTAAITVELREVKLANKPPELFESSPKATVPIMDFRNGSVIDESMSIMRWALKQNDPNNWLFGDDKALIELNDGPFKYHLDRYKYPSRYRDENRGDERTFCVDHRNAGYEILCDIDERLRNQGQLCRDTPTMVDIALFPFVRQFANTDLQWFGAQPIPRLQQWLKGHLESELFKLIMPKFAPWKAGDKPITFGPLNSG